MFITSSVLFNQNLFTNVVISPLPRGPQTSLLPPRGKRQDAVLLLTSRGSATPQAPRLGGRHVRAGERKPYFKRIRVLGGRPSIYSENLTSNAFKIISGDPMWPELWSFLCFLELVEICWISPYPNTGKTSVPNVG